MNWAIPILVAIVALLVGVWLGRRRAAAADSARVLRMLAAGTSSVPLRGCLVDSAGRWVDSVGAGRDAAACELHASDLQPWNAEILRAIERGEERAIEPLASGRRWPAVVQPVFLGTRKAVGALIVLRGDAARDDSSIEDLSARNAAILQSSLDGFFIIADDYRFIEVNAAYCRMVGYTPAELMKLRISDLEVPLSRDGGRAAATNISRTGHHLFAAQHRHKEGHIVELEISVIALKSGGRKTLVGFARNVTDRLRAERTLAEREKQYRDLVETSHDLIWSVDRDGRWTFVNREAVTRIYGYEPEEMLGRAFVEFMPPEQARKDLQTFQSILAGEPRYGHETVHLRKDGAPLTLLFNAIAMRNEAGEVVGTTGTAADITARKQAEERLRLATERFESVARCMPMAYIFWSRDFRVQEWNPAAESVFGYSAGEAIGRHGEELLVADASRDEIREMWNDLTRGVGRDHGVFTLRRKDGETIRCEWSNAAVHDADGAVSHVGTLIRDISERERLEAQLRRTQKMESLGILAGGVAHDFNNALVGILCNASLALEKLPADTEARMYLTRILNAGRRSSELTRQMLVYAGRATPDVRPLALNELITEMSDLLRASIPRSVTLTINLQPDLPHVLADGGQMQQVVMNLLMNAAEAIGERTGTVTISSYTRGVTARQIATMYADSPIEPGTYASIEVSDTGCGMTPETQARIFDPFFTTKFTGRGLGLAAILGIIRAHRGVIRVSSQVGQGSVFTVLLPTCETASPKTAAAQRPGGALRPGTTVLIVDDEPDIREVVQSVLEGRGVQSLLAKDGYEALEIFRARHAQIDVVLLDLTMPGMSGEAVLAELQAIDAGVKVVMSSGYVESRAARPACARQTAGFIQKPFTMEELVETLDRALAGGVDAGEAIEKSGAVS